MSYTKLTDFAAKDALLSGNPSKVIRGTEIDAEFSSLQTESALLAPKTGIGATGTWGISVTGNAATATSATNATNAATATSATNATNAVNLTGTIASAVTAVTQTAGNNSTKVATTAYVKTATDAAVGSSAASGANADITSLTALIGNGLLPVGTIITHAASTAPSGYLKANGALVSRSTYAALFTVIGTTFGAGDGSTTFALPDLRGEFIRGWDDARGIDSGRAIGTSQGHAVQDHTHASAAAASGAQILQGGVIGAAVSGSTTGNMNSGTSAPETRPRNIALLACIKY